MTDRLCDICNERPIAVGGCGQYFCIECVEASGVEDDSEDFGGSYRYMRGETRDRVLEGVAA